MKLSTKQVEAMSAKGIPEYMQGGIIRYYENGIPPGDFLSAVINNDLQETFGRADDVNRQCIRCYVMWFYNHAPAGTWGYQGAVAKYLQKFHKEST